MRIQQRALIMDFVMPKGNAHVMKDTSVKIAVVLPQVKKLHLFTNKYFSVSKGLKLKLVKTSKSNFN